jgi:protein-S-isoprenylcysteine O-methyltransferase Ste14
VFTDFPYSVIRHPLALVECLMVWCFLGHFYSLYNAVTAAIAIGGSIAVVAIEEQFLMSHEAYRQYCRRVPWRMLPGVW